MVDPGFFVDRLPELEALEKLWASREPGLVVIYGRRRTGKTRLILEWLRGRRHVYYQAGLWPGNLEGLVEAAVEQLGVDALEAASPRTLRGFFQLLAALLGGEQAAVVIDEFTYWLRVEPGVVSELQYVVDHVLPSTRLLLVLSGSIVGLMERGVVGGGAPLYGRARLRRRLRELEPWCLPWFLPGLPPERLVEAYALLGGIPFYLRLARGSGDPLDEFLGLFGPGGVMEDEPLFLLREEFRDPHPYLALLRSLAQGASSLGEAAQRAGMPTSHASKYLHVLVDLGLVEREPLLFQRRRSRYRVADNMLAAWLAIVEPAYSLLRDSPRQGRARAGELAVQHYSKVWEALACRHAVGRLAARLGVRVEEAGRLVHRGVEVDCVVVDNTARKLVAVEAKWADLSRGDASRIVDETASKLLEALPARLRNYKWTVAVYARKIYGVEGAGGDAVFVDAASLPWGPEGCPSGRETPGKRGLGASPV